MSWEYSHGQEHSFKSRSIPPRSGISLHVQEYPSFQEYPSLSRSINDGMDTRSLTAARCTQAILLSGFVLERTDMQVNDLRRYILCG